MPSADHEYHHEMMIVGITCRTSNAEILSMKSANKIGALYSKYCTSGVADKTKNRKSPGKLYCVYAEYENGAESNYTVVLGEEVSSLDGQSSDLTSIKVPAQNYVKFTNMGVMPEVCSNLWQKISATPKSELGERSFVCDYEVYEPGSDPKNTLVTIYIGVKS